MKHILWIFALISASAFADAGSDSAKAWIKTTLANQPSFHTLGTTPEGQQCALVLADEQNGNYSVTLAIYGSFDPSDFVQVAVTAQTQIDYDPSLIFFTNGNTVGLQMDGGSSLTRAVGTNLSKTIDCRIK
jgi:hypothetical protein